MTRRARLLIVGEDFKPKIRSYSTKKSYRTVRRLELGPRDIRLDIGAIQKKVKELQEKYPDKGFYFEKHKVMNLNAHDGWSRRDQEERHMAHSMVCWIFGRREKGAKNIPLYWSSRFERLYVPQSYVKHQKRLTASMILYRLRDLGVSYNLAYA